jgi:hypothetical protein
MYKTRHESDWKTACSQVDLSPPAGKIEHLVRLELVRDANADLTQGEGSQKVVKNHSCP